MFHHWLHATDGTGSTVTTAQLDFRKAFDLVDHHMLVAKLLSLGVKPTVLNWVIDFLRSRQQRVKLNGVLSDWLDVPAGVPQGTRLGLWLLLAMINDLRLPEGFHMWKFANDPTASEVVPASKHSLLQEVADYIHELVSGKSSTAKFNQVQGDPHMLQAHSPLPLSGVNIRDRVRNDIFG